MIDIPLRPVDNDNFRLSSTSLADWELMSGSASSARKKDVLYANTESMYRFLRTTVSFVDQDGNQVIRPETIAVNSVVGAKSMTMMSKYASDNDVIWKDENDMFIGHDIDEILENASKSFMSSMNSKMTSHKRWDITISRDGDGGTFNGVTSDSVVRRCGTINSTETDIIPYPSKEGWDFIGWMNMSDRSRFSLPYIALDNIQIKARYAPAAFETRFPVRDGVVWTSSDRKGVKIGHNGNWYDLGTPKDDIFAACEITEVLPNAMCYFFYSPLFKFTTLNKSFRLSDGYVIFIYPATSVKSFVCAYNVVEKKMYATEQIDRSITDVYKSLPDVITMDQRGCLVTQSRTSTDSSWSMFYKRDIGTSFSSSNITISASSSSYPYPFMYHDVAKGVINVVNLKDRFGFGYNYAYAESVGVIDEINQSMSSKKSITDWFDPPYPL